MVAMLSQADVQRLMRTPSPQVRAIVASKLAQDIDKSVLTETETEIAHDIIRKLAGDVEVVVRRSLSQSLRSSKHLPHDVAVKLANDVEAVSLPILTDCIVLTDEDLIEILQFSSPVKQRAIAARPEISESVSDAVIKTTSEIVVSTLMSNKTAKIAETSMTMAIERFSKSDLVKESMVKRDKLPVVIAEKLAAIVSDRLQDYLIAHHELPEQLAADLLMKSRERSVIQLSHESSQEDTERLVGQMHKNGRLTPTLVLRALCVGNLPFFEFAVAVMAEVPITNARILIHDPGSDALRKLSEKAGFPANYPPIISTALGVLNQLKLDGEAQDIERFRARVIERILTQAETLGDNDVEYFLDLIK